MTLNPIGEFKINDSGSMELTLVPKSYKNNVSKILSEYYPNLKIDWDAPVPEGMNNSCEIFDALEIASKIMSVSCLRYSVCWAFSNIDQASIFNSMEDILDYDLDQSIATQELIKSGEVSKDAFYKEKGTKLPNDYVFPQEWFDFIAKFN